MFNLRRDVQVDQAQGDVVQAAALAHQPAIHTQLCPVQGLVVGSHGRQRTAEGLDFFQGVARGIETIGTPPHPQALVLPRQADLGLMFRAAPAGYQHMALAALLGGGGRREAQVQVAALGSKLAQVAHRHRIGRVLGNVLWCHQLTCVLRTAVRACLGRPGAALMADPARSASPVPGRPRGRWPAPAGGWHGPAPSTAQTAGPASRAGGHGGAPRCGLRAWRA
jgi:hypothetical protein